MGQTDRQTDRAIPKCPLGGGIITRQIAAVMTANGRIAAAIYRIRLRISSASLIFPYFEMPLKKCPFPSGDPAPQKTQETPYVVPWAHPSLHPKRFFGSVHPFQQNRFDHGS